VSCPDDIPDRDKCVGQLFLHVEYPDIQIIYDKLGYEPTYQQPTFFQVLEKKAAR
jgi:hypothetical protein